MPLITNIAKSIDYTATSTAFKKLIEDHLSLLLNDKSNTLISLEPQEIAKYRGDLYGLLTSKSVAPILFYPIMRVNGYSSSNQFEADRFQLILPNAARIEQIFSRSRTVSISS